MSANKKISATKQLVWLTKIEQHKERGLQLTTLCPLQNSVPWTSLSPALLKKGTSRMRHSTGFRAQYR